MLISHFTRPTAMVLGGLLVVPGTTARMPETLNLEGVPLQRNGQGTRERFLINLYSVGLYLSRAVEEVERIRQHDQAKLFRVEVVYDGSMTDEIPDSWYEELTPVLDRPRRSRLRNLLRDLKPGDILQVSYLPGSGTQIQVRGETVLTDPGHGLMSAYIDLWLGGNPVSESLREDLL